MAPTTQDSSRQFTWAFWACALVLLLVAAELARNYHVGALQIRVEGNLSPDEREQLEALLDPYVHERAFWLDSEDLAKDLGSLPWVGAVEIRSNGLSRATVKVSHSLTSRLSGPERTLVNAIRDLARANQSAPVSLVRQVLQGDTNDRAAPGHEKFVFMAFDLMLDELGIRLNEVNIDASGRVVLHMDAGKTLMLGSNAQVDRAHRFARIYQSALKTDWHRVAHVDARYADAIAVRHAPQGQLLAGHFVSAPIVSGEGR
ncbi:MAG: hypothetical protein OXF72_02385 [Gammaproteobacteria bacterium]|nr:hypothetical protein [Gammaproteobacteria bacterium]MCY4200234.1 hypothetical protein [Gammaproteobacteria bacterium]MCY4277799.1 hypothetical protein [Gammaproteobacteria bacterium]MCY4322885.1 hypothetical protein [Gammaproteobacteria bacterium]